MTFSVFLLSRRTDIVCFCVSVWLSSFPKAHTNIEQWPSHDGDPLLAGGHWLRSGQSLFLYLQRTQGSLPEHQGAQRTLPVEHHCWYKTKFTRLVWPSSWLSSNIFTCIYFFSALFGALGVLCFLAAMRHHSLTDRVANYQENLFVLVVLDDSLDWSFWLGVGSIATHFAICGVVAMSRIKLPKPEIKKPEEPTISALDLLYWKPCHTRSIMLALTLLMLGPFGSLYNHSFTQEIPRRATFTHKRLFFHEKQTTNIM